MAKQLKVYGWITHRHDLTPGENGGKQAREIAAVHSVAEVLRLTGMSRGDFNHSGSETGNPIEVALAVSNPGVVLFKHIDSRGSYLRKTDDGAIVEMTPDPNLMRAYVLEGLERNDRLASDEPAELAGLRQRGFITGVR
jgi:hypothetical protein